MYAQLIATMKLCVKCVILCKYAQSGSTLQSFANHTDASWMVGLRQNHIFGWTFCSSEIHTTATEDRMKTIGHCLWFQKRVAIENRVQQSAGEYINQTNTGVKKGFTSIWQSTWWTLPFVAEGMRQQPVIYGCMIYCKETHSIELIEFKCWRSVQHKGCIRTNGMTRHQLLLLIRSAQCATPHRPMKQMYHNLYQHYAIIMLRCIAGGCYFTVRASMVFRNSLTSAIQPAPPHFTKFKLKYVHSCVCAHTHA